MSWLYQSLQWLHMQWLHMLVWGMCAWLDLTMSWQEMLKCMCLEQDTVSVRIKALPDWGPWASNWTTVILLRSFSVVLHRSPLLMGIGVEMFHISTSNSITRVTIIHYSLAPSSMASLQMQTWLWWLHCGWFVLTNWELTYLVRGQWLESINVMCLISVLGWMHDFSLQKPRASIWEQNSLLHATTWLKPIGFNQDGYGICLTKNGSWI